MDKVVAKMYRRLMQEGFKNAGSVDNPTMFIDSKAEAGVSICGEKINYVNIYIKVSDGVISDIKYLCNCEPGTNVVVEVLCNLAKGLTIENAKALTKEQFFEAIGIDRGPVRQKVWGIIELLNRVIKRYEAAGSIS